MALGFKLPRHEDLTGRAPQFLIGAAEPVSLHHVALGLSGVCWLGPAVIWWFIEGFSRSGAILKATEDLATS